MVDCRDRMTGRQRDELIPRCAKEERLAAHQECASSLLDKRGERHLDLALTACIQHQQVDPENTCRNLCSSRLSLNSEIVGIDEHTNCCGPGHQFVQQFEPLCDQFHIKDGYARHVPAGSSKAIYEAKLDRVGADNKNDR